jgi:hypothetical protein
MAEDNYLGDAEKAEEVGASVPSAILVQPASLTVAPTDAAAASDSTHSDETQADQGDSRNLEELAAVSTGPVYSAFSTGQKRFIVLMVSTFQLSSFVFLRCRLSCLARKFPARVGQFVSPAGRGPRLIYHINWPGLILREFTHPSHLLQSFHLVNHVYRTRG